jgi:hypothetical protein
MGGACVWAEVVFHVGGLPLVPFASFASFASLASLASIIFSFDPTNPNPYHPYFPLLPPCSRTCKALRSQGVAPHGPDPVGG